MRSSHGAKDLVGWVEVRDPRARAIVSNRRRVQPPLPGDHSNNYTGTAPKLVDPGAFDYRPQADSPLVDAGRAVDGVTAAYEGGAPDVGAYEFGGEHWLPGHRNGVWLVRSGSRFSVRLNLPILEAIAVRVMQEGKEAATLRYTPEDWSEPQTLPASIGTRGPLAFETDEWGGAVVADVAAVDGLADARAAFVRADVASARQVDSRPKFDYEYSYTAEPIARPAWRAYCTQQPPVVDGALEPQEWPGWDATRAIHLLALREEAAGAPPAGEGYALFDGEHLYLAVRVTSDGDPSARGGGRRGPEGSGVEVALARVERRRAGPAFVLRADPSGKLESVTDGGADAESARRFAAAVAYAARRLGTAAWSCEFRIPLAALGVEGEEANELRFNLGLRRDGAPGGPRFAAVKTGGPDYAMAKAGVLRFDRSVRAGAPNLLTGGTFASEETAPWRVSANRRDPLPEGTVERVRQGLHQDACIRIRADDAEAMKERVIKWTHPVAEVAESPGRYCLSYHVRVVGERLSPRSGMGSFNSYLHVQRNGRSGGNLGQRSSMLTTTGDRWGRQDFVVNVPPNVKPSMISLQLHQAAGTVLVDNVSLLPCRDCSDRRASLPEG